jgi:hypothetical protein
VTTIDLRAAIREQHQFQKFKHPELTAAPPLKEVAADMFLTMRLNGESDLKRAF